MPQGLFSNSRNDMGFLGRIARISEDLKLIRTEQQNQTKVMVHNARRDMYENPTVLPGAFRCGQQDCPVCGQTNSTDQTERGS